MRQPRCVRRSLSPTSPGGAIGLQTLLLAVQIGAAVPLVDTIGFTQRDLQVNGPAVCLIVNDPARGVHAVWQDVDGYIRYNFRPSGQRWKWRDGRPINPQPRTLGNMTVNHQTGQPIVGAGYLEGGVSSIVYLVDSAVGASRFEEQNVASGYRCNLVAASRFGWARSAALDGDSLYYRSPWSLRLLDNIGPFPGHNIVGSRKTGRFCFTWTTSRDPLRGTLKIQETPNNGANWFQTVNLSDLLPSPQNRCLLGATGLYDSISLHLVAGMYDGSDRRSSTIWHYAKYDSPPWSVVHRFALPDSGLMGAGTLAAGRPSIGLNPANGDLFVTWEQFDDGNIEPVTGLARSSIWASRSTDDGNTWGPPSRLTPASRSSDRFPFLAEVVSDTLHILFFSDQVSGFWELGEGPQSRNPVTHVRVAAHELPVAVAEPTSDDPPPWRQFQIAPPCGGGPFTIRTTACETIRVHDGSGRLVDRFRVPGGRFEWFPRLPTGVYSLRSSVRLAEASARVIIIR